MTIYSFAFMTMLFHLKHKAITLKTYEYFAILWTVVFPINSYTAHFAVYFNIRPYYTVFSFKLYTVRRTVVSSKKHLRRVPTLNTLRFHENFYARYVSARVELIYLVYTEFLWDCKGVVPCILEVAWATLNKLLTECCCDVRVTPHPIVTRPWCFSRINSIYQPVKKYFATVSPTHFLCFSACLYLRHVINVVIGLGKSFTTV